MKRAVAIAALTTLPLIILGFGPSSPIRKSESAVLKSISERPDSLQPLVDSGSWLKVLESLVNLSTVQRSLAAADIESGGLLPDAELLLAQVATTGLGPINIGMTLDEVKSVGLSLVPTEKPSATTNCRYYRVKDLVEPIDFMAVDNRIIRIDVWPGSFAETLSGIKIGSSEEEIYSTYGDRIKAVTGPTGNKQLIFTPSDPGEDLYRLVFDLDDKGTVVHYRAGQFPAVTWPGGCH